MYDSFSMFLFHRLILRTDALAKDLLHVNNSSHFLYLFMVFSSLVVGMWRYSLLFQFSLSQVSTLFLGTQDKDFPGILSSSIEFLKRDHWLVDFPEKVFCPKVFRLCASHSHTLLKRKVQA